LDLTGYKGTGVGSHIFEAGMEMVIRSAGSGRYLWIVPGFGLRLRFCIRHSS